MMKSRIGRFRLSASSNSNSVIESLRVASGTDRRLTVLEADHENVRRTVSHHLEGRVDHISAGLRVIMLHDVRMQLVLVNGRIIAARCSFKSVKVLETMT